MSQMIHSGFSVIYKYKWHFENNYVEKAHGTLDIAHSDKDIKLDNFSNYRPLPVVMVMYNVIMVIYTITYDIEKM